MASMDWRRIPTVLYPQEILDKAFRKASKQPDLVEDPDKYHRTRKQMDRMVQSAADVIDKTLLKWVDQWPSLNALSEFDQALIDAAVGNDEYRKSLGTIQGKDFADALFGVWIGPGSVDSDMSEGLMGN